MPPPWTRTELQNRRMVMTDTKQSEMTDVIESVIVTAAEIATEIESEETAAATECVGKQTEIKS